VKDDAGGRAGRQNSERHRDSAMETDAVRFNGMNGSCFELQEVGDSFPSDG
jgi:hypothetical protein